MRTDRSLSPALAHDVAVAELISNAGRQFDPEVVDALLKIVEPVAPHEKAIKTAQPDWDRLIARQDSAAIHATASS